MGGSGFRAPGLAAGGEAEGGAGERQEQARRCAGFVTHHVHKGCAGEESAEPRGGHNRYYRHNQQIYDTVPKL